MSVLTTRVARNSILRDAHRYDGCVVDDENMLDGHGGDLCDENPAQGVDNGCIGPYQLEFNVVSPHPVDDHLEILLELLE